MEQEDGAAKTTHVVLPNAMFEDFVPIMTSKLTLLGYVDAKMRDLF